MTFPVYIAGVHPHVVFELLAYATGVALIVGMRRRTGDVLSVRDRWSIAAAGLVGGAIGARLLSWLSEPTLVWPTGKTIVGGLAGGLIAVELTKRAMGVRTPTGDLFALPLAVCIAIGRIGCFLSGLDDHTYGTPTSWPTGVDFGDGIARHPTALYEAAFLAVLALGLVVLRSRQLRPGVEFKVFIIAYLGLRLALDFIKPEPVIALGLSAIQWACVGVLGYYAISLTRSRRYVHA